MPSFQEQIIGHRQQHLVELNAVDFPAQAVAKILAYGAPVGAVVEHAPRLSRCADRLLDMMKVAEAVGGVLAAGTTVIADTLSHSIGRFDRHWHAPLGGVWLTMAWPDTLLPEFSRLLPFAAGLACCRTIQGYTTAARLKWVNDVLIHGRKVAGILCSTVVRPGNDRYHLLGIGLNGNNRNFPEELRATAISLAEELGRDIDLAKLIGRLLAELSWAIGLLHYDEELSLQEGTTCEQGRTSRLLTAWQQHCDTVGQRVQYGFDVQTKPLYQAVVTGLDPCGGLRMQLDDGSTVTEYSGEIVYC